MRILASLVTFQAILSIHVSVGFLPIEFDVNDAKDASNLRGLNFVNRFMIPYGPDLFSNPPQSGKEHPYKGYGFGMGAAEGIAYDTDNHYLYAASDQGFIIIVDNSDPRNPKLTDLSFDLTGKDSYISSIEVCSQQGVFFLSMEDNGTIEMYETVKRGPNPQTPRLLKTFDVGPLPQFLLPNKNCDIIAVGNANRGKGLAAGGVTFVRNPLGDEPEVKSVPMDKSVGWDDAYVLEKGLHMPLSLASLEYWDDYSPIADELNFTEIRANYKSAIFLEPKFMAWSGPDETELLVNLQENNGLMRIDVASNKPLSVASYGLKDFSKVPVDINADDGECIARTYESLFAMKNPDTISTVRYNDKVYIVTANEGDIKEYSGFEDAHKAEKLFDGDKFALPNVIVPTKIMNPENISEGHAALFNSECKGDDCVSSTRLLVGSTAIDYDQDPKNPIFYRMVMYGGRGWSIYELPDNPDDLLKLVYDSAGSLEKLGCQSYPWSHNARVDEEDAPTSNFPNNTLWQVADEDLRETLLELNDPEEGGCADQGDGTPGACPLKDKVDASSAKEGPGVERITVGVACGRLFAVTAIEKTSVAYLYDITNVGSPELKKVFHLSEAIKDKSPGLAYNEGTIGEIDPENILFFPSDKSPSGKPSLLFAGAFSGTFSYWEFDCVEEDTNPAEVEDETAVVSSSSGSVRFFKTAIAAVSVVMLELLL